MQCVVYTTTVTRGRIPVFNNPEYAETVVSAILYVHRSGWAEVYAFVVMPNHMHILFLPKKKTDSEVMMSIKGYTARTVNEKRGTRGPLWQDRFHKLGIESRKFMEQKIKYTEENPVRAGLCLRPEDWPWSSARFPEILALR